MPDPKDKQSDKPSDKSPEPVKVEVKELKVTLVKTGQNQWRVKTADGKDLKCDCGRPVEASLHNVSVDDRKLGPCPAVTLTK